MSLSTLASSLGLSISTVSRALNGYTDVNAETRARVFAAAEAIGYKPNPVARRLATGKTGVVGLVTTVIKGGELDNAFVPLLAGMSATLQPHGYSVIATGFPEGADETQPFTQFVNGGFVDGIVVARTRPEDDRVKLLTRQNVPFVTYGQTLQEQAHAWIDVDNVQAFYAATQRLIAFGHSRIALLNASLTYTFSQLREDGYRRAMDEAGLSAHAQVRYGETAARVGFATANALLGAASPPSALLCVTDSLALGAMAACREAGKTVGQDVSVIGFGNSDAARYAFPGLTTIEQTTHGIGEKLAQFLMRRIEGGGVHDLQSLEPTRIVVRQSDGPPLS
jgi:LacI family transcriptional regulator